MKTWHSFLAGFLSGIAGVASAQGAETFTRQVTFELTFSMDDLTWLGDPASPAALVYVKPGAQPIATDVHVSTLAESHGSPCRHYMREARIATEGKAQVVYAFTEHGEKVIGAIDDQERFAANDFYAGNRGLLPSWPADAAALAYDPQEKALYYEVDLPGPQMIETLDFLPLALADAKGNPIGGRFSIDYAPNGVGQPAVVVLNLKSHGKAISVAKGTVPKVLRRDDVQLESFDNSSGTYLPESAYRAGASDSQARQPSVTLAFFGEFTAAVNREGETLVVEAAGPSERTNGAPAKIAIDGNFDDWRNVVGVDDPRGDLVPYLEYVPDVDLLEFKVSHDEAHIYLYARVAGQVGRCHPEGGRGYFYAYMDVDCDPGTGFLPSRDDDCYFGVNIGDDCEVQFEFVDNTFRKTFYGFCGLGGDENVLKRAVTLGRSQYGRIDERGIQRANYKAEYIYRDGATEITEDLKLGTSDTIRLAVSPDGHEVEIVSAFEGFLKDPSGRPTVAIGQTIDLAAGMECDSSAYPGKTRWAADSTVAIRGYRLSPAEPQRD